ncbi:hypothetical protein [Nocardia sp. NPDC059239]|uniref:hypothetical protein n=1 Tax=unclassified Nocardia TaxID=2637762 RepID=UPI0036767FD6
MAIGILEIDELPWLKAVPGLQAGIGSYLQGDLSTEELELQLEQASSILDRIEGYVRVTTDPDPKVKIGSAYPTASLVRSVVGKYKNNLDALLASRATEAQVAKVKDTLNVHVTDPEARQELAEQLLEMQHLQTAEQDARIKVEAAKYARDMQKADLQERRWKMWWNLLQREPVAVLIGAMVLVMFSVVLIVAMWTHTAVPEVMVNMLLLILGFFFGQTTSGRDKASE